MKTLWYKIQMWWMLRQKQKCDSCSGTFRIGDLSATSGDWWMCDACMDKMWTDMTRDSYDAKF